MEKRSYSEKPKGNQKKYKKTKHKIIKDPCAVCNGELYLDDKYTQRIGLINDDDEVTGWQCPHCKSEYDLDNKIVNLGGLTNITGEA